MKTIQIGKLKFWAWGCWWLEPMCDRSTDVLARAILLYVQPFLANDSVISIVIIHRVSPVVTVYLP